VVQIIPQGPHWSLGLSRASVIEWLYAALQYL
jgi:hypothetical protein